MLADPTILIYLDWFIINYILVLVCMFQWKLIMGSIMSMEELPKYINTSTMLKPILPTLGLETKPKVLLQPIIHATLIPPVIIIWCICVFLVCKKCRYRSSIWISCFLNLLQNKHERGHRKIIIMVEITNVTTSKMILAHLEAIRLLLTN